MITASFAACTLRRECRAVARYQLSSSALQRREYERGLVRLNRDALLFMATSGIVGLFSAGQQSALSSGGDTITQLFWSAAFLNAVLLATFYQVPLQKIWRIARWLLPLMIWLILSVYWSAYPELTLRRAIRVNIEVFTLILLVSTYSRRTEPLRILFLGFVTLALLDCASLAVPSRSFGSDVPGFQGLHGHKNSAGEFYFFALPLFGLAIFNRSIAIGRYLAPLAFFLGTAFLLLSRSKTAIGLFAVTTLCVFAIRSLRRMREYSAVLLLIYLLIGVAVVVAVSGVGFTNTVDLLTGDLSFTGRTAVWDYVLARWQQNPYFGGGFGALWQVGVQMEEYMKAAQLVWVMNEAHNGYLDVLAQTGIIGLLFLVIFLLVALHAALFARTDKLGAFDAWKWYVTYVTLGVLLYNLTESTFVHAGNGAWQLFVVLFATTRLPKQSTTATADRNRLKFRPSLAPESQAAS
jgi:O-antigen ligase